MSEGNTFVRTRLAEYLTPVYHRARPFLTAVVASDSLSTSRQRLRQDADKFVRYDEEYTYTLPRPTGPEPTPSELDRFRETLIAPEPFVCELSNIVLVGWDALAITPQHRYIIEEANAKPEMLTDSLARTVYRGTLPTRRTVDRRLQRPVVSLTGVQSCAYFHWFADYLPRVRGIEWYAETTGTYPDVLVPPDRPSWMTASIVHVGLPDERLVEWNGDRAVAERFVLPSVPRKADTNHVTYDPRALRWVGDRIRSHVGLESGERNRILITRRSATTRRFVNEDELVSALSPLGFEPVDLTQLSFEEQVALFANAEIVVGAHGAGLINTIYATNTKVFEIFGDFVSPLYYCIAGGLGFPYRYEQATDTRLVSKAPGISVPGNDLIVEADRIEAAVRGWVDEEREGV
jgi:capsular polysaccharide biosynthesis protein